MADEIVGKKEYDELVSNDQRLRNLAVFAVREDAKKSSVFNHNQTSTFTEIYNKLKTNEERKDFRRMVIEEVQTSEKLKRLAADKVAEGIIDGRIAERKEAKIKAEKTSPGFPGLVRN